MRIKLAEDLRAVVLNGVTGTLMSSWEDTLSADEIDAVLEFIRRWPEI